jgi:hypothetical protein
MIRTVPLHTTLRTSRSLLLTAGLVLSATLWSTAPAQAATFNVKLYGAKGNGTPPDKKSKSACPKQHL